MKPCLAFAWGLGLLGVQAWSAECPELLHFSLQNLSGPESVNFCEADRGKVIFAVNTASRCGFTPQFKELEA
jgi:glutathione peroxidase